MKNVIFSEQQATINSVTFWYISAEVNKNEIEAIAQLKSKGFWEACLWGENVTLIQFGRI